MKTIYRNIVYLFTGNMANRVLSAIGFFVLANYLGPSEFGVFSVALVFATICSSFSDFGISQTFIREASQEKESKKLSKLVATHLKIRLLTVSAVILIIFIILVKLYESDSNTKYIIMILVILNSLGFSLQGVAVSYFQALQRMGNVALISVSSGVLTATVLLLTPIFKFKIEGLVVLYGSANIVIGIVALAVMSKEVNIFIGWSKSLFKGIWSFSIGGIFIVILPQLPILAIDQIGNSEETGYFSLAYRIPLILYSIPGIIATAYYPALFKAFSSESREQHNKLMINETLIMFIVGSVLTIPFIFHSDYIVRMFFGVEWSGAITPLTILSLITLLQAIGYPLADSLTTRNMNKRRVIVMAIVFSVASLTYIFIGIKLGSIAIAYIAVSTQVLMIVGFMLMDFRNNIYVLSKGISKVAIIFLISIIFGVVIKSYLYPSISIILNLILFLCMILVCEKSLRSHLFRTN